VDLELMQERTIFKNLDTTIRYLEVVTEEADLSQGGKSVSRQRKPAEKFG